MSTAWIYAGQGSQTPGMGRDFYDEFPEVRDIFDSAAAGFDLRALCFDADAETLARTRYTQPCMAAFAAAVTRILRGRGFAPDLAAGLSLGEYSALHASGVFGVDTLLSLLAFRGLAMEESAAGVQSRMSAVLGLSEELVRQAVAESSHTGVVACTNINCPGQIVIGGELAAVLAAEERCSALGARRCMPLNTSGPFHTPLMEGASSRLREKFAETEFSPQQIPVLFNATGDTAPDGEVKNLLCAQVKSTVLFEKTLRKMVSLGADAFVEIGPGSALSGFVRKTAPELRVVSVNAVGDLKKVEELWN
ncbi:MAG: ACP S-malonyltransferase [Oscillospiraceae bacterium]|nr:ACP S-malonyltransferase [Oscillospiraceae bacterium]